MPTQRVERRTMQRELQVEAAYKQQIAQMNTLHNANPPCPLCIEGSVRVIVDHFGTMCVIENDFPYSVFDGVRLQRHLMLIPVRHIALFEDFNEQEQRDYWRALTEYTSEGYNTMTRSTRNFARSVPDHLHTHMFLHVDGAEGKQ
ncbi:MAG: hypothetical protein ABIR91_01715 [Candidatus Saccharimonadales bacterium]